MNFYFSINLIGQFHNQCCVDENFVDPDPLASSGEFCFICFSTLYAPVNNFSVISGLVFLAGLYQY